MKQLSKLSILLLFVALAFCACDKNDGDDNGKCIYPKPASVNVYNYSVTVETVVDAPQAEVKAAIEQDLEANFSSVRTSPRNIVRSIHKPTFMPWSADKS